MLHPVQAKVRQVQRRAKWVVVLRAVCRAVAVVLLAGMLLGLGDFLLRSQDVGLRLIASAVLAVVLVAVIVRWIAPAWRYRPSLVEIAQRIEARLPQLEDRLSSTIEFLEQSEETPHAGSAELRRTVIAETSAAVERLDLNQTVVVGSIKKGAVAAGAMLLILLLVSLLQPEAAARATARLVLPLSPLPWPRIHSLAFENPPGKIAQGDDLELVLVDHNGRLPREVDIELWYEGDAPSAIVHQPMQLVKEKMVHQLHQVSRSFRYRATGGDDQTPWQKLEAAPGPRVESLSILLIPPDYTGWAPSDAGGNITVLAGTTLVLRAKCNMPLSSARLLFESAEETHELAALLTTPTELVIGKQTPWVAGESGTYWLEIVDEEGLRGASDSRYELHVLPDRPPLVSLEAPPDDLFVSPQAVLPVKAVVQDDIAIAAANLRFSRSDQSDAPEEKSISIYRAATGEGRRGESQAVEYQWNLAEVAGLQPGTILNYFAAAGDFNQQWQQSTTRRLTVVSQEELEERLGGRQGHVLSVLDEALAMQRESRRQTKGLEILLENAGRFSAADIDLLQSAELNQRRVLRLLAEGPDSVVARIEETLRDLQINRIDSPAVRRQLEEMLAVVSSLTKNNLPEIEGHFISALKISRLQLDKNAADAEPLRRPLADTGLGQEEVVRRLEELTSDLAQWDHYRRFFREVARLRRQQEEVWKETEDLGRQTLGRDFKDLEPQQRGNLLRLAERQNEFSRRFDRLAGSMEEMQGRLEETDPLAAQTLADALETARRLAISGQMRQSGANLEQNRVGQAVQLQREIAGHLEELLNVLANRTEHELSRLVDKLNEASGDLADLQKQQAGLKKKFEEAQNIASEEERRLQLERLAREQEAVAKKTEELARRLERLQAEEASQTLGEAAGAQQQASQQADQGTSPQQHAENAEQKLEQAQQEIQQRIAQAEQDLVEEQLAQWQQEVAGLHSRQQRVLEETQRLQSLRDEEGELSPPQAATLASVAEEQSLLQQETEQFAVAVAAAEAFQFALETAGLEMTRAVALLERGETGDDVQRHETAAANRLAQLLAALENDAAEPGEEPAENPSQPPPNGMTAAEANRQLAQLRLVRILQEQIALRTAELDAIARAGSLTDQQTQELADLSRQQGGLADLVLNLSQPAETDPQNELNQLPDPEDPLDGLLDDLPQQPRQ